MKKKTAALWMACVCLALGACSGERDTRDASAAQGQWLRKVDGGSDEPVSSEGQDVFLVEPIKSLDQVASLEERQSVIQLLSQLTAADFEAAMVYDSNVLEPILDDQLMLLFEGVINDMKLYGYNSAEYGSRGIILSFNGEYSYYDFTWPSPDSKGGMRFYEQDFDHDGIVETAFCFGGAAGTGVSIDRLLIFDDVEGKGMPAAYEFTPEMQLEQFEKKLRFVVDMDAKELSISREGAAETSLNWGKFGEVEEGAGFGIDCFNQIAFEVNGDEIRMCSEIGVLINRGGPTLFFEAEEGGELYFDLMYADGGYEIK